ncbi:MAG: hypothetical protein KDD69_19720 [Bdellovibrionales bacterium]|nr:hypothetical protein [Bdellovibrionales bacterium]
MGIRKNHFKSDRAWSILQAPTESPEQEKAAAEEPELESETGDCAGGESSEALGNGPSANAEQSVPSGASHQSDIASNALPFSLRALFAPKIRQPPKIATPSKRRGTIEFRFSIAPTDAYFGTLRDISLGGKTLRVTIPAGVPSGTILRIKHEQDLVEVKVSVEKSKHLRLEGADVYLKLPLTLWEAISGHRMQIRTPRGPLAITIEPGWEADVPLAFPGYGVNSGSSKTAGTLYVEPYIVPPQVTSDGVRHAAQALNAAYPNGVRKSFPPELLPTE